MRYFDERRYIVPNGVDILPFRHCLLRENVLMREISGDFEWQNDVLKEKKVEYVRPYQANNNQLPILSPPVPDPFKK